MKKIICVIAVLLNLSAAAFGDIARPEPTKTPKHGKQYEATMMIRLDRDAKEARLIIPKSQLKQLRAELEQLDGDADATAAASVGGTFTSSQTIISGMFLSLAFVFGGVWFVRSGKGTTRASRIIVIAIATLGVASAANLIYANVGPPQAARSITGKMFSPAVHLYKFGSGKIKIESGDSKQVELIVPDREPDGTTNDEE